MTVSQTKREATSRLLEEIQRDLPLIDRPYAEMASRCGISESEAIGVLEQQHIENVIREISAIIDGRRIGFQSTLVAVRTPKDLMEKVARRISAHSGVSHNYQRNHFYNIWFTVAVEVDRNLVDEIEELLRPGNDLTFLLLPSVKTYKLRVHLSIDSKSGRRKGQGDLPVKKDNRKVVLSEKQRKLLARLESPFPLVPLPWKAIADQIGESREWVIETIGRLKASGVIRRIAGVLRHRRVGYTANGMSCFAVPLDRIDEAGQKAAEYRSVSHCYHREAQGTWQYPLFAMIHAKSKNECRETAQAIAAEIHCEDYQVLFSVREFKKERVRYFGGAK